MATKNLLPVPKFQFLDNNGKPVPGGKCFTYSAGTTNKLATFTDQTGSTPNSNPIICDANGRFDCWLTPNTSYKIVFSPSTDGDPPTNPFWTENQVTAIPSDATSINFLQAGTGAVVRSIQSKARELASPEDYFLASDPDDTLSIQRAIDANSEVRLLPGKTYIVTPNSSFVTPESGAGICVKVKSNLRLVMYGAIIKQADWTSGSGAVIGNTAAVSNVVIEGGIVDGNKTNTTGNMPTVVLWDATDCDIRNATAINSRWIGLGFRGTLGQPASGRNAIKNCRVKDAAGVNPGEGIGIQCSRQAFGLMIHDNFVENSKGNNIDVEGDVAAGDPGAGARISIQGNIVNGGAADGIFLESVGEAIVAGNTVQNIAAGFNGLILNRTHSGAYWILVQSNRFKDISAGAGVRVRNSSGHVLISGNSFENMVNSMLFELGGGGTGAAFVTVGLNTHSGITDKLIKIPQANNSLVLSKIYEQTSAGTRTNGIPFTASPIDNAVNFPGRSPSKTIAPAHFLEVGSAAATLESEYKDGNTGVLNNMNTNWGGAYSIFWAGDGETHVFTSNGTLIPGRYVTINGTLFKVHSVVGGGDFTVRNSADVAGDYTTTTNGLYAWVQYFKQWQED